MTTWLLSYMGRVKYSFIPKKDSLRTNILRLGNQRHQTRLSVTYWRHITLIDVTERTRRDENGNVTLMAQGAKQEFILHIAT